jgi:hypothetical protein
MKTADRREAVPHPATGIPVDASGGATVDPTKNVLDLVAAATLRIDDLAEERQKTTDAKIASLTETIRTAAAHQRELDQAESARLNSIRQVDREEVSKTAVTNQTATTALANQTAVLAETLRTQVSTVAAAAEARAQAVATAAENRLNQFSADVIKRLSALELSSSEGKGKQQVSDPAMERLAAVVEQVARTQQLGTGKTEGYDKSWAIVLAVFAILWGFYTFTNRATPAPMPAPVIQVVPYTPPAVK